MAHPVVWFEVLGKNGDKLQRFYGELFGWKFKVDGPPGYGTVDKQGSEGIPGGVGTPFPGARPGVTFYVRTPDLAASLAAAERMGGRVVLPPQQIPGGPPIALFEDPEGHLIGLVADGAP